MGKRGCNPPRSQGRFRRGASLVEFALVLPFLLLLVAWCLDFGRVWHSEIIVGNAARIASTSAALRRPTDETRDQWEANIRQAATDELSQMGIAPEQVQVVIELDTNDPPAWVRVDVNCPFETAIDWPGLPPVVELNESTVSAFID